MNPKVKEILFGLILGLILNGVLAAVAPVLFGAELTLMSWAMGVLLCTVVAMVMIAILPIDQMKAAFARSLGTTPDTTAGKILGNVWLGTLLGIVLVFLMIAVGTGFDEIEGVSFIERYISGFITIWPIVIVALTLSLFVAETIVYRPGSKKHKQNEVMDFEEEQLSMS